MGPGQFARGPPTLPLCRSRDNDHEPRPRGRRRSRRRTQCGWDYRVKGREMLRDMRRRWRWVTHAMLLAVRLAPISIWGRKPTRVESIRGGMEGSLHRWQRLPHLCRPPHKKVTHKTVTHKTVPHKTVTHDSAYIRQSRPDPGLGMSQRKSERQRRRATQDVARCLSCPDQACRQPLSLPASAWSLSTAWSLHGCVAHP